MLDRQLKEWIKKSIYETGVNDIHIFCELYGMTKVNKALLILDRIRKSKGLNYKQYYANCTKVSKVENSNKEFYRGFYVEYYSYIA